MGGSLTDNRKKGSAMASNQRGDREGRSKKVGFGGVGVAEEKEVTVKC